MLHIVDAPAQLVEHCTRSAARPQAVLPTGGRDAADIAALVTWLTERDEFADHDSWVSIGMALKLELGEVGRDVWALTHNDTVTGDVENSKWSSFANEPKAGCVTLASWMKKAHDAGWKGVIRPSTEAMFGDIATLQPQSGYRSLISGGANHQLQIVPPEYSEIEVASRFANDYCSAIRFLKARGCWLYWNGRRWIIDDTDHVPNLAKQHCQREAALCASTPGNSASQARSLCSDKTVNAVLRLTRTDQRIASRASDWDQDIWLLGTPDGVVDLRKGVLRAAKPEDGVTKRTAVAPEGGCPTWLKFLQRATAGDIEMQKYLQRLAGYCLTGSTQEQSLHFTFGPGRTGKSTFLGTLSSILRDYHVTTAIETLTESRSDRHPTEIAALQGARLVTCSETERGRHWAESRIKQLTGGDEVSARFMNQDFFTFVPTFKLLIAGNYKPHLRPDSAMRRRFQLIPFDVVIPETEQDPKLSSKLEKEWPGILGWMIEGALLWQKDGLTPPTAITSATTKYMDEEAEDTVSNWLTECCVRSANAMTKAGMLYSSYRAFAERAGEKPITDAALSRDLVDARGFTRHRTGRDRFIVGIALVPPPPPPPLPPIGGVR